MSTAESLFSCSKCFSIRPGISGAFFEGGTMRKRVFEIIELSKPEDKLSRVYDGFMLVVITASLIPLAFKAEPPLFVWVDAFAAVIFIIDYLLRWGTADYKLGNGPVSFLIYPFTLAAIVDLVSILPSVSLIGKGFKILRVTRMLRAMRVLRAFKTFRYSKNFAIILSVLRKSKQSLVAVGALAVGYILIAALVIFNVEPDTFSDFFEAIYWATVSLTTMGYGDIYPVSAIGRLVTIVSSFIGIAIVALPAGIITAGYMEEVQKED